MRSELRPCAIWLQCSGGAFKSVWDDAVVRPAPALFAGSESGVDEKTHVMGDRGL